MISFTKKDLSLCTWIKKPYFWFLQCEGEEFSISSYDPWDELKSKNRCRHCSLFRVSFSVLSFKNYYFSPLKGSTHWYLCWTISIYFKQSISFLLSKEIQFALFSATLYAMWPLQWNSLGEFHLILQTGETLPDSRLLLQMIYVYS